MKKLWGLFFAAMLFLTSGAGETAGEIAHYPMRDGSGTQVKEARLRLPPGVIKRSFWTSRDGLPLVDFGGTENSAEACVILPEINLEGAFTIAVWLNARQWKNNWAGIVYRSDATYGLRGNAASPGRLHFRVKDPDDQRGSDLMSNTILDCGRWYHLAAVFKPGEFMKLYIDGKLDSAMTKRVPEKTAVDDQRLRLGGIGKKNYFSGNLTDLHLFNRALSEEEVAELYQSENRFARDAGGERHATGAK